jgi:hypothetical protein
VGKDVQERAGPDGLQGAAPSPEKEVQTLACVEKWLHAPSCVEKELQAPACVDKDLHAAPPSDGRWLQVLAACAKKWLDAQA